MTVLGVIIHDSIIDAAVARMRTGLFRASDIQEAIRQAGEDRAKLWAPASEIPALSDDVCMRAADRLIRRERARGNIKLVGNPQRWVWDP